MLEAPGLGVRVRRDDSGSDSEVGRAHVEAFEGGNGGPPHIHLLQEERFIVHTGVLLVRRSREAIPFGPYLAIAGWVTLLERDRVIAIVFG